MRLHSHMKSPRSQRQGSTARRLRGAGAALVAAMLVAGCTGAAEDRSPAVGNETGATAPAAPGETEDSAEGEAAQEVVITISDFSFDVPDTIAPGTRVTIRNEDRVGHTVTSDEDGLFDVIVGGGQEATLTVPDEPGEYPFFCKPHPNMVATLVVG